MMMVVMFVFNKFMPVLNNKIIIPSPIKTIGAAK
jgi:hypothetical protein